MKKKLMLLISVMSIMLMMTGCFKLEAGIVLNSDGTGEIYNKSLIAESFKEGTTSEEMFNFTDPTITPIEEMVNGEKYVGELSTQKFTSLEDLSKITETEVKIKKEGNVSTLSIAMENEETAEELDNREMIALMKDNLDVKFKVTVPGKVLQTNGDVTGNTVIWDLLKEENSDSLYVKYENASTPTPTQQKQVKVTINNREVNFVDQKPVIVDDRTLVPIRMISEELGMEVLWDNETRTAKIFNNEKSIFIKIGEKDVITYHELNEVKVVLDVPAQIINERTMIPLRAISEILNIQVEWNQDTYTAILTK